MNKPLLLTAALSIAFLVSAYGSPPVSAMGSGDDTATNPATKCKTGQVWDKKKKKCVKATSGIVPDEELFQQGRMLAKSGHYDWAIEVLTAAQDKSDPRILNYIGYSYRKKGEFETGLGYYRQALAIDPEFVLAREYLGEGYVATGRVDLAKVQLAEIEKRCGTNCEEYQELAEHIASAN